MSGAFPESPRSGLLKLESPGICTIQTLCVIERGHVSRSHFLSASPVAIFVKGVLSRLAAQLEIW
ncbi:hypothetical protein TYRP_017561 [Tyrophagus putrescentiae]|nr:hypothetical protein TYRP_017561 [Tyrophagus putrescentiae]